MLNEKTIRVVMLVSGLLTCTMIYAAIAPGAALRSNFGETLSGPVAEIVVRNWGGLIALIGAMLIYGAYRPAVRPLVLFAAAGSKVLFITLVLVHGRHLLGRSVGAAVVVDSVMVLLFAVYLLKAPQTVATA